MILASPETEKWLSQMNKDIKDYRPVRLAGLELLPSQPAQLPILSLSLWILSLSLSLDLNWSLALAGSSPAIKAQPKRLLVFHNVYLRYKVVQPDSCNSIRNARHQHQQCIDISYSSYWKSNYHKPWIILQSNGIAGVAFYLESTPGCHLYFRREGGD